MKRITAALALACALILTGSATAVDFGANDDRGKYAEDGGAAFFGQMATAGLRQNVMTVRFLPSSPLAIPDQPFLDVAVPTAAAAGIVPVFAVYPYPPSEIEAGAASPAAFAAWLEAVARTHPQVRTFIVGNEPNLNSFWRPQGDGDGRILSAPAFGPFLAAGYDALKAVSSDITVLGLGLSPRGDDAPGAAGKSSPVHVLGALGDWYRASGRSAPLMDGLSYHPYPNPSDFTVPFTFAYGWPSASVQELGRIKQAVWDAFEGTGQPTTRNGLRLYLDEVGWQVDTSGQPGYTGAENVAVASEAAQAAIYGELVRYVVCDPDVAQVNFFGYCADCQPPRSSSSYSDALTVASARHTAPSPMRWPRPAAGATERCARGPRLAASSARRPTSAPSPGRPCRRAAPGASARPLSRTRRTAPASSGPGRARSRSAGS